jgi:SsrA-binding protein
MKILLQNKKAYHDYNILDKIEAGIVLKGDEVKSLKRGQGSLTGSFAVNNGNSIDIINMRISPYDNAYKKPISINEEYATRTRRLLLKKREIKRLIGDISKKGITLVPLKVYLNDKRLIKVEIAIAKHKKAYDRKSEIKERDVQRETRRELKNIYKYK